MELEGREMRQDNDHRMPQGSLEAGPRAAADLSAEREAFTRSLLRWQSESPTYGAALPATPAANTASPAHATPAPPRPAVRLPMAPCERQPRE